MKHNRKTLAVALVTVVVGGTTSLAMFQNAVSKKSPHPSQEEATVLQEEATILQDRQITDRQKRHSKLFKHSGRKLREIAAEQPGDIVVEEGLPFVIVTQKSQRRSVFQSALCRADAVVVGTIKEKTSQFTDDEKSVFTDYQVTVEEVIKNNASSPISTSNQITTTRDGGAVVLNNRTFRVIRESFNPAIVSKRYLLFLRFIPETGSYLMYGNGTFQLEAEEVLALGPGAREEISKQRRQKDVLGFLNEIRSYSDSQCLEDR